MPNLYCIKESIFVAEMCSLSQLNWRKSHKCPIAHGCTVSGWSIFNRILKKQEVAARLSSDGFCCEGRQCAAGRPAVGLCLD